MKKWRWQQCRPKTWGTLPFPSPVDPPPLPMSMLSIYSTIDNISYLAFPYPNNTGIYASAKIMSGMEMEVPSPTSCNPQIHWLRFHWSRCRRSLPPPPLRPTALMQYYQSSRPGIEPERQQGEGGGGGSDGSSGSSSTGMEEGSFQGLFWAEVVRSTLSISDYAVLIFQIDIY